MVQSLSKSASTILELEPTIDVWVNATWDEFISFSERAEFKKAKAFYFNGQMRIEAMGVGADPARDNSILALVVSLFCITMGISIESFTNVSYGQSLPIGHKRRPLGPRRYGCVPDG